MSKVPKQWELPVSEISPDPKNPRSDVGDLTEMVASIQAYGIIQPLVVRAARPEDAVATSWVLVAGERRLRAAKQADLKVVPVCLYTLVEDDPASATVELAIIENLQRSDLSPVDTAKALQSIIDTTHESADVVAARIGKSPAWVRRRLALLDLPDATQDFINQGLIPLDAAPSLRTLVGKVEPAVMESVARDAAKRRLTAAAISNIVAPLLAPTPEPKKGKGTPAPPPPLKSSAPAPKAQLAGWNNIVLPSLGDQGFRHTTGVTSDGATVVVFATRDHDFADKVRAAITTCIDDAFNSGGDL